jgi:hypothetical protein
MTGIRIVVVVVVLIIIGFGLVMFVDWYQNRANPYWKTTSHVSMAGSGNPWPYLTDHRCLLLRSLHDGYSLERIEEILRLPADRIMSDLRELQDIGLASAHNGSYYPAFFIANRLETEKTYAHARMTGRFLADELLSYWNDLEQSFSTLHLSQSRSFEEIGFMLVGGRILDIGMLGALVKDGTLLTPAPPRPTPDHPDGRYYLWMVEGDLDHVGRYGQDDTSLPQANWHFLTFAQNIVSRRRNPARRSLDRKFSKLVAAYPDSAPDVIARELAVDFLSRDDSRAWAGVTERISSALVTALKCSGPDISDFYGTLRTGQDSEDSFGEFFVWYYHLAFAWAIEDLAERGILAIPRDRCSALILYREGKEGLLTALL